MAEIWKTSPQKGTRLLMLLAIADHANDEGIAWPSQKHLAHKCRMSKRQAQNLIKDLVSTDELDIEELGTGRGHSTIYRVKPASTFKDQRVKSSTSKGEVQRAKRVKSSSPEPLKNHHSEPSGDHTLKKRSFKQGQFLDG